MCTYSFLSVKGRLYDGPPFSSKKTGDRKPATGQQYERKKVSLVLVFLALFGNEVGATEGGQHGNARAQRAVCILIARFAVVGQHRCATRAAVAIDAIAFRHGSALEQAASIWVGKRDETQSKGDCYC